MFELLKGERENAVDRVKGKKHGQSGHLRVVPQYPLLGGERGGEGSDAKVEDAFRPCSSTSDGGDV